MSGMPSRHRRVSGIRTLQLLGLVAFAAAVGILVWFTWTQGTEPPIAADPKSTSETSIPAQPEPLAVYIGDSYTQGSEKWPDMVSEAQGWNEVNLGRGGTGYWERLTGDAASEGCGLDVCPSFAEMAAIAVKRQPDIVIVAGGRNDGGRDITDAAQDTFSKLREGLPDARIVAVQPMWDASDEPAFLTDYGKVIKNEVEAVDGEYLKIGTPLKGRPELVQADGVHPTAEGQEVIATAVNKALSRS
jgi:acyl-CoA thioesterase I